LARIKAILSLSYHASHATQGPCVACVALCWKPAFSLFIFHVRLLLRH